MSDLERGLLAHMTTADGMAHVVDAKVAPQFFEDPINRVVFEWITQEYWPESQGKAPTLDVLRHEFPSVDVPHPSQVQEATTWLIGYLQRRHARNQAQELLIGAAKEIDGDPMAMLRSLVDRTTAVLEQQGRTAGTARLYTDVAAMLDDALPESPNPEVLRRADGVPLFYRNEVNLLFGDPEHGKTWVGLAACAEVLAADGRVLVADIDHNGAAAIVSRLLMLGAPKEALCDPERFRYCEPGEVAEVEQIVADCAAWRADVVLVDSTGELLPMFGASSDSGDDFTHVHNRVLQPLADSGAVVLLVDHLAKGKDSRALGPGGSMAKRRTVGGVSVRVVRERPFTRADGGAARLLVNKDRHGGVRDHCAAARPGRDNDEQLAGTFVLDPTADGGTAWTVTPPEQDSGGSGQEFRPTVLMERASRLVEDRPGVLTRNQIAEEATGKKGTLLLAVDLLEREGYVTRSEDTHPRYTSARPYRQAEDPQSERQPPLGNRLRRHQEGQGGDDQEGQADGSNDYPCEP
ncbi:hypothetical protein KUF57_10155 [Mycolicibacterium sp. PAM1]|uniref:hypothetical protein n=1 Tax=Mycolicibacterium sp. PAM1 TaxID=2853535 RepID=UPI001C3D8CD7|nr:hypothetical protein [Mycolicibacterium sp. PAM1]MBV5243898.1 hypothetical protein [Mycolicibacterium sp. PAM1]